MVLTRITGGFPPYNPRADYFEETLNSALLQPDPGPEQMQSEVLDDGSMDNTAPDR